MPPGTRTSGTIVANGGNVTITGGAGHDFLVYETATDVLAPSNPAVRMLPSAATVNGRVILTKFLSHAYIPTPAAQRRGLAR